MSTAGANEDNKDSHLPCLYPEVLPTQSTMTMMTLFYDATTTSWSDAFLAEGKGGDFYDADGEEDNNHNDKDDLVFLQCGGKMMSYLLKKVNLGWMHSWQRGEG